MQVFIFLNSQISGKTLGPRYAHTLSRGGQERARKLTSSPGAENPSYALGRTSGLARAVALHAAGP